MSDAHALAIGSAAARCHRTRRLLSPMLRNPIALDLVRLGIAREADDARALGRTVRAAVLAIVDDQPRAEVLPCREKSPEAIRNNHAQSGAIKSNHKQSKATTSNQTHPRSNQKQPEATRSNEAQSGATRRNQAHSGAIRRNQRQSDTSRRLPAAGGHSARASRPNDPIASSRRRRAR